MTQHLLDRPVWNALHSGWSSLAEGDGNALRMDPRYGPFAAARSHEPSAQLALSALVPEGGETWIVENVPPTAPPGTRIVREAKLVQMVAQDGVGGSASSDPMSPLEWEVLTDADAEEMRALAHLTKPGPFLPLTHRLGRFIGIKQDGQLIAMAGERMRVANFTEVSGVCTHPDHRGQGHAKALMQQVTRAIQARGETPFLHAYAAHGATIALYESLGFRVRAQMHMLVIARA